MSYIKHFLLKLCTLLGISSEYRTLNLRYIPATSSPTWLISNSLAKGWYRIALNVTGDQHNYLFALTHNREYFSQKLFLINGRQRSRFIRIPHSLKPLYLVLLNSTAQDLDIKFYYRPYFSFNGRYLKYRFLCQRHELYPSNSLISSRHRRMLRWRHYNSLFLSSFNLYKSNSYPEWIRRVESRRHYFVNFISFLFPLPKVNCFLWPEPQPLISDSRLKFVSSKHNVVWSSLDHSDWVLVLPHHDFLTRNSLKSFSLALNHRSQLILIYSDSDFFSDKSFRLNPQFKPDWNPDLLYSDPGYSRGFWVKSSIFSQSMCFLDHNNISVTPYSLLLAISFHCSSDNVCHLPEILMHHKLSDPQYRASKSTSQILQSILHLHGFPNLQVSLNSHNGHTLDWPIPSSNPILVSIIIPTKDNVELLQCCISSIKAVTSTLIPYEIIIIDNGSSEYSSLNYLDQLSSLNNIHIIYSPGPFNYSSLNNEAVLRAKGNVLAFLNNDVEILDPYWLNTLASNAMRADIGCVGARLLYPDGSLQHGGVVLGIGGIAGHSHKHLPDSKSGFHRRAKLTQNFSAVTGAVLFVKKSLFEQLGGFDSLNLKVSYNDVDLCLRSSKLGFRNLWCAEVSFIHFESKSRGSPLRGTFSYCQWMQEREFMKNKWGNLLKADPHYNPNLSLIQEDFSINMNSSLFRIRRASL